jgi:hypothetical protein
MCEMVFWSTFSCLPELYNANQCNQSFLAFLPLDRHHLGFLALLFICTGNVDIIQEKTGATTTHFNIYKKSDETRAYVK